MKKQNAEFNVVAKAKFDEKPKARKYLHILNMEVRDPKTKVGQTIEYEYTPENYVKICSGVIPRFNRNLKPKRWEFSISADKKRIMIQRIA